MTVSPVAAPQSVRLAMERAAETTGVDFSYLVATAYRESGFDPNARAGASTAAGLFQFVEQTWLAMVKRHGADHGLGAEARQIEQTAGGDYRVADPEAASAMAGEYAAESAQTLTARLGRQPTASELYAAHFLGAAGAVRLIQAAQDDPSMRADTLFPQAARANRAIFRAGGEPATVAQVLAKLGSAHGGASAVAAPPPDGMGVAPAVLRGDAGPAGSVLRADGEATYVTAVRGAVEEEIVRQAGGFALPHSSARVLSPLVIEALAALDTPVRAAKRRA